MNKYAWTFDPLWFHYGRNWDYWQLRFQGSWEFILAPPKWCIGITSLANWKYLECICMWLALFLGVCVIHASQPITWPTDTTGSCGPEIPVGLSTCSTPTWNSNLALKKMWFWRVMSRNCTTTTLLLQQQDKVSETWVVLKEASGRLFKSDSCIEANCNHHEKYHP